MWSCCVIFLVSSGIILKLLVFDSLTESKVNESARKLYYEPKKENKFSDLLKLNNDIVGWIYIKNTNIDYPVLKSPKDDSDFYLSHDYKKEKSKYGSIFLNYDYNYNDSKEVKNTVLYGHHMADGQMFADLIKFSDLEFYREHPIIKFDTLNEEATWKIISIFKTNTLSEHGKIFNYTLQNFSTPKDFLEYIEEVKKRSLINIPVVTGADDKLLILSTCSYEFKDFRTVIVAKKLNKGESLEIDTSLASKAENPLMPQCWYERYGGVAPS